MPNYSNIMDNPNEQFDNNKRDQEIKESTFFKRIFLGYTYPNNLTGDVRSEFEAILFGDDYYAFTPFALESKDSVQDLLNSLRRCFNLYRFSQLDLPNFQTVGIFVSAFTLYARYRAFKENRSIIPDSLEEILKAETQIIASLDDEYKFQISNRKGENTINDDDFLNILEHTKVVDDNFILAVAQRYFEDITWPEYSKFLTENINSQIANRLREIILSDHVKSQMEKYEHSISNINFDLKEIIGDKFLYSDDVGIWLEIDSRGYPLPEEYAKMQQLLLEKRSLNLNWNWLSLLGGWLHIYDFPSGDPV